MKKPIATTVIVTISLVFCADASAQNHEVGLRAHKVIESLPYDRAHYVFLGNDRTEKHMLMVAWREAGQHGELVYIKDSRVVVFSLYGDAAAWLEELAAPPADSPVPILRLNPPRELERIAGILEGEVAAVTEVREVIWYSEEQSDAEVIVTLAANGKGRLYWTRTARSLECEFDMLFFKTDPADYLSEVSQLLAITDSSSMMFFGNRGCLVRDDNRGYTLRLAHGWELLHPFVVGSVSKDGLAINTFASSQLRPRSDSQKRLNNGTWPSDLVLARALALGADDLLRSEAVNQDPLIWLLEERCR